jgi:peptidoglycan/LPS O-acetylase OafA/YrhL
MQDHKVIYFPGLNGLRAIAAIGVVLSHITISLGKFKLDPTIFGTYGGLPKGLDIGVYGVTIFFTLSGFLITYLLLAEKEKSKDIDIKKFYLRRLLRIWPLYYLYLFACLLVILLGDQTIDSNNIYYYLFYASNILLILYRTALPYLGHYWSLGVEEQFYLFWPWVVKKSKIYFIPITSSIILILTATKIVLHFTLSDSMLEMAINTNRFHCMLIGALGAAFYYLQNELFLKITTHKITQFLSWLFVAAILLNQLFVLNIFLDNEIVSIVSVFLIMGQITVKNRLINLEIGIFDYLGKISYGIYVIHPLLILLFSKVLKTYEGNSIQKYFLVYTSITLTTIGIAHISYEYFEKYFIRLKDKFTVVKSSATKQLS